jgi:hypothetical protein
MQAEDFLLWAMATIKLANVCMLVVLVIAVVDGFR